MRKLMIGLVATFLVAAPATLAAQVKIGMITTLSGGGSALGVAVRDGFKLALEQEGGKLGGTPVELLVEDDARKPGKALQVANRFMKRDKVDIMTGIIWSNLAIAVVPKVVETGVFYISPNAGPSKLAGEGCHPNYFNVAWQNDNLHEAMGQHVAEKGYKNAYILAPNYPAGKDALGASSASTRARWPGKSTPSSVRRTTRPRSRRCAAPSRTRCSSFCPAAWASASSSSTIRRV